MSTFVTFERPAPRGEAWNVSAQGHGFSARLLRFAIAIEAMLARRRSRLALLEMSDDQLKDIGLGRADAEREGRPSLFG
jgi:uncharacterized protein YjiS (DUF1127 family)